MATYYTGDLIPDMTSNTAPKGTVSASTEYNASYAAWKAVDDSNSTMWLAKTADSPDAWWQYEFVSPQIVQRYTLTARPDATPGMAKDWTFEGYNGATWDVLDTVTNETSWGLSEKRTFDFVNTTAYTKYRVNITANNGGTITSLAEVEMIAKVETSDTSCSTPTIGGTDALGSINYLTIHDTSPARTFKSGNIVKRSDGKILITYSTIEDQKFYVSWVDTEADLYTEDNILTNETEVATFTAGDGSSAFDNSYTKNLSYLFKTSTGRLLLFTLDPGNWKDATGVGTDGTPSVLKVYESSNGLGTDFSLLATIFTGTTPLSTTTTLANNRMIGLGIVQEFDGRVMLTFGAMRGYGIGGSSDWMQDSTYFAYSDDYGDSWSTNELYGNYNTNYVYGRPTSGVAKCGNTLLLNIMSGFSNYVNMMMYSADNGSRWYSVATTETSGDVILAMYTSTDGYSYIVHGTSLSSANTRIYRRQACQSIDLSSPYDVGVGTEWAETYHGTSLGDDGREYLFEAPSTNLIYAGDNSGAGSGFFYYATSRTVSFGVSPPTIATTTATIFICDYQGTVSAETGTVETSVTVASHGLNVDDFLVNTTQDNTSRRILATTTDTMTVVTVAGQTVSDIIRTYVFTDHTDLLKEETLNVVKKIQEDTEAKFVLVCDKDYVPRAGQYVKININSQHVFTGFLRSVKRRLPQNGVDTKIFCDCECITLNAIPPRRTLDIEYTAGTTASTIVESLINNFLVDEGVASGTIDTGTVLPQDWNDDSLSIGDIMDSLAEQSGYQWMIDRNWQLQFYQDPTTISSYSATISDLSGATFDDFRHVVVNETIDNYNNKAFYVGNNDDYGNIIVVSQETTASILEIQDITAGSGVYGAVVRDSSLSKHAMYTATAGTTVGTVVATGIDTVVDVGDLVFNSTKYERMNVLSVTTDTLTVDSAIVNEQDDVIVTYEEINDIVDNHLKRQDQIPKRLEFDSFTTDFEPGQKLQVALSKLTATTTETYVIDEVSIKDRGANYFVAHVVADKRNVDNFSTQRTPNYKDYYRQF